MPVRKPRSDEAWINLSVWKQMMDSRGWTQAADSPLEPSQRRSGQQWVQRALAGVQVDIVKWQTAFQFAKALGVQVDQLLTEAPNFEPDPDEQRDPEDFRWARDELGAAMSMISPAKARS